VFGGIAALHDAYCDWEIARSGDPGDQETFERLLAELGFLMGEIEGTLLVSGLAFREDVEAAGLQTHGPPELISRCQPFVAVYDDSGNRLASEQQPDHNCSMSQQRKTDATVSLGRHRRARCVCAHQQREEIEAAFIGWRSPAAIADEFGLADRASVYRHAHALGLFQKRQRNVRTALERIIEKAGEVDVTASAVVAAVQAYAKINAAGEWIDRSETTSMNDLFDRMSTQELETYAQTGALPEWFNATVGITSSQTLSRATPQSTMESKRCQRMS
jgi:hypothetical protein